MHTLLLHTSVKFKLSCIVSEILEVAIEEMTEVGNEGTEVFETVVGIGKKLYGFPFLHFIKQPSNRPYSKNPTGMH